MGSEHDRVEALERRIAALEESLAFAERADEQLSDQIAAMDQRIFDLQRAVARLRESVGRIEDKDKPGPDDGPTPDD